MIRTASFKLTATAVAFAFSSLPSHAGTGSSTQAAFPTFGLPDFPTLPMNGSFEYADPFSSNPFGWTNNSDAECVWPAPSPITAQDGTRVIAIGPTVSGFRSYTTDITNFFQWPGSGYINKCDPAFDFNGGDVTISFWYYIPSNAPITAGPFGLKVNAKGAADPNQDNATWDPWASGGQLVTGHTNNQWVQYTFVWAIDDIRTQVLNNAVLHGWTLPPYPDRIKLVLGRFDNLNRPHTGTIYIDNVLMTQGSTTPAGCNLADITEIGGTAEAPGNPDNQLTVDDIIVFINLFSDGAGCPGTAPCSRADVTGIGGPPELPDGQLTVDDIIGFFNAFGDGCPA